MFSLCLRNWVLNIIQMTFLPVCFEGYAMGEAVICRPVTAEVHIWSHGIFGKVARSRIFSKYISFLLPLSSCHCFLLMFVLRLHLSEWQACKACQLPNKVVLFWKSGTIVKKALNHWTFVCLKWLSSRMFHSSWCFGMLTVIFFSSYVFKTEILKQYKIYKWTWNKFFLTLYKM